MSSKIEIIAITDHDSLAGFFEAENIIKKNNLDILLLPGCEVSSRDGHILAYNITKEIRKGMSAARTIDEIHAQNGIAVAAHPFNQNSLGEKIYDLSLDALEGLNATTSLSALIKAFLAAKYLRIPNLANSDAHQAQEIGRSFMLFPESTTTIEILIETMKSGNFATRFTKTNTLAVIYRHIVENVKLQYLDNIKETSL
jgi:predicted metal-dependent phosphoesterase TrpH